MIDLMQKASGQLPISINLSPKTYLEMISGWTPLREEQRLPVMIAVTDKLTNSYQYIKQMGGIMISLKKSILRR